MLDRRPISLELDALRQRLWNVDEEILDDTAVRDRQRHLQADIVVVEGRDVDEQRLAERLLVADLVSIQELRLRRRQRDHLAGVERRRLVAAPIAEIGEDIRLRRPLELAAS